VSRAPAARVRAGTLRTRGVAGFALLAALAGCGGRDDGPSGTAQAPPAVVGAAAPPRPAVDLTPSIDSLPLLDREAVRGFYAARGGAPAWLGDDCATELDALRREIAASAGHGLTPSHYHAEALAGAACDERSEVLASDAWMALASDLYRGRVVRTSVEPNWNRPRPGFNGPVALETALDSTPAATILPGLAPQDPYYRALREMLELQRLFAARGGWLGLPAGPKLERGDRGLRVDQLRRRLMQGGLLDEGAGVPGEPFDEAMEEAVKVFQRRSNLEPDGVVGVTTQAQLDKSAEDRVAQLRANLERWRWMQFAPKERHVRVFIADFRLERWDENGLVREHKVIVGKRYRNTPSFAGAIERVVFAPRWHVPRRLAVEDKLPMFQKDPGAFHRLGFDAFGKDGEPVQGEIEWDAWTAEDFPYLLRQRPGAANALGQVKILFPNEHDVYLHDTPTRNLFAKVRRDFSSGCIRVEDTLDLADWLLEDPAWNRPRIDRVIAAGQETTVRLEEKVPVYIVYLTVAYDETGGFRFLDDLYGRDAAVVSALDSAPAG
jgi:murein L,D-transpeptidase YcbB/YkuD